MSSKFMFVFYDSCLEYQICADKKDKEICVNSFQELLGLKDNINRELYKGKEIFIMEQECHIIESLSNIEGTMEKDLDNFLR